MGPSGSTATFHYKSRRTEQAAVVKRIREICEPRVRYGYRRVHVLLEREGWAINIKKTYRIYRELGLQLKNKAPKPRVKVKRATTASRRSARTRSARWTSSMTNSRPAGRCGS